MCVCVCVYTGMCVLWHFCVYLYLRIVRVCLCLHAFSFLCLTTTYARPRREKHISSLRIFKQSTSVPTGQNSGRSTGRESAQLLNVTHFSGEFSNTIEPEQENRNILLFHEQYNQTTLLANQHCLWKKGHSWQYL